MSVQSWQQVRELFEQALARPPAQRAAFLVEACGNDAALRSEIESLLAHHDQAPRGFMCLPQDGATGPTGEIRPFPTLHLSGDGACPSPRIEGYEIIRELGHGGMGVVYQARDTRLERMVAVKTILGEFQSRERLELLRREARLAARLRHPNIVAVHALIDSVDPPCIIMEWVDGVPLDAIARRLSFHDMARLMLKVARAVAYAHEMGVIHRDLKPGNILVDRTGEPRLLDFGLARGVLRPEELSSGAALKGTPLYMAPEQFAAPSKVGPAADIYALGLVLYVLLTGSAPPNPRPAAGATEWANREIPPPRELNSEVPEPLQRICLKACELRPQDRYARAADMADDLQRYLDGREVRARPMRYTRLLSERVRAHVDALAQWEGDNLITRREADSLVDRYMKLLRAESLWVPGARRLRPGAVILQAGGWLVVLSAVLWVFFYWTKIGSAQRVLWIGLPTVIINAAAAILWRRFSQLVALIFTVVGTLLIPLFGLVLLHELGVLSTRADYRYELFGPDYFSNRQLAAVFWLTAAYAIWLLWRKRFALLAALLAAIWLVAIASTLLLFGLKEWLTDDLYATTAAAFSPVPVVAYLVARRLDRPAHDQLAVPFYAVAGVSFLIILGVLAYDAPDTWFGLTASVAPDPDTGPQINPLNIARELSFLVCGLACFLLALVHDRSGTRLRRLWGALYFRVVPPSCVIPLDYLGKEPLWSLGTVGREPLQVLEFGVPVACVLLLAAGTRLQLRWFAHYGLLT